MDDVDAGDFSVWLAATQRAIRGEGGAEVPCDGCTACCRSSQFVHIGPDERETLAHIPAELVFPAPRMPRGHVVLGYDERGHCPMLVDDRCSIYAHRPRACRVYDCRVFAAAGLELDEPEKREINERVRRWRFRYPTTRDREQRDAVQALAAALRDHPERLPAGVAPTNATQVAVFAVESVSQHA
jgi:Fe-S-cluster containining protein